MTARWQEVCSRSSCVPGALVVVTSCAARDVANAKSGQSDLGAAISTLDGIPVPGSSRPLTEATLAALRGQPQVAIFRLPGTISDAEIQSWYRDKLPQGTSWRGLSWCAPDDEGSSIQVSAAGQVTVLHRSWRSPMRHLDMNVTREGGVVNIDITYGATAPGAGYGC